MGPVLPADRPSFSGLKRRGALGEPGRSRRCAPRARESDALPVTQAEREPLAPSGSRRRAPTTERDRRSLRQSGIARRPQGSLRLPRPARAASPREDTTGSTATEERGSNDAVRRSSVREIGDFPLAVRTRRVLMTLPETSGKRPESVGFWQHHESASLSRTTASSGSQERRGLSGFPDSYLNTTVGHRA